MQSNAARNPISITDFHRDRKKQTYLDDKSSDIILSKGHENVRM